jgi:plastocyanin
MRALSLLPVLVVIGMACGDDEPAGPQADFVAEGTVFIPTSVTSTAAHRVIIWGFAGGPHNVTWEDLTAASGDRSSGTYQRDFTSATLGTKRFRCTIHSTDYTTGMVGQVVVQ